MKSTFGSLMVILFIAGILMIAMGVFGMFAGSIFKVSEMTDSSMILTSQQYYYQLYQNCLENPQITNKSDCDIYLNLSMQTVQSFQDRQKTYLIFGSPLVWILTGVISIVISLVIGNIQIPNQK